MDEAAIAQSVIESILEEAGKVRLKPVAAGLSCGTMLGIDKNALCEAFKSLAVGTLCEGISLGIREVPAQIRCNSCGVTSDYSLSAPRCRQCGSDNFHFLADAPILLEDIEFKEP